MLEGRPSVWDNQFKGNLSGTYVDIVHTERARLRAVGFVYQLLDNK